MRGTPLGAVRDGRGALALLSPGALSDTRAHDIAELVLAEITDFLGTSQPVRMGVGAEVDDLTTAWQSHHQADLAVRAVPILGAGPIAHWGSLGALQLLLRIPAAEMSAAFVPAAITAVREADASGRLVETLERYLRCGGGRHRRDDAHPPEPPSTTGSTGFAKSPDSTSTTATHDSTCTSGWSPIAWSSRPVATPTPPADRRARLSRSRRETR